jgi:Tol biopolymer transport system component
MTISIRMFVGALAFLILISTQLDTSAAPKFTPWGPPENLGCATDLPPGINSTFNDEGPALSTKGDSLYFGSNRPTAPDDLILDLNLWVTQWEPVDARWGEPTYLGPTVNSAGTDNIPLLSRDGHWLFFNSDRPGGQGGVDIWVSWRPHVDDDFGWETPVNLGPVVNTSGFDGGASYLENDDEGVPLLFFGSGPVNVLADIYVSELRDGAWGTPQKVEELSTTSFFEGRPSVRFDGLELFLFSNRSGLGLIDLWQSTREDANDPWEEPTNLGSVVNSAAVDQQPHIAADRQSLFFVSNRPGGCGGGDIYLTTRNKVKEDS